MGSHPRQSFYRQVPLCRNLLDRGTCTIEDLEAKLPPAECRADGLHNSSSYGTHAATVFTLPTGEDRWDVVREVTTAARVRPGMGKEDYVEGFKLWLEIIKNVAEAKSSQHDGFATVDETSMNVKATDQDTGEVEEVKEEEVEEQFEDHALSAFQEAVANSSIGIKRWPLSTTRGYLGLGIDGIQVGDTICIFEGSHVPYVILEDPKTPGGRTFNLVCKAYVRGLMQSEGMSTGDWEEISLD